MRRPLVLSPDIQNAMLITRTIRAQGWYSGLHIQCYTLQCYTLHYIIFVVRKALLVKAPPCGVCRRLSIVLDYDRAPDSRNHRSFR